MSSNFCNSNTLVLMRYICIVKPHIFIQELCSLKDNMQSRNPKNR